ncbi:MAG: ISLre2 family transposase, partial [Firmicutes bacterium]|nr:ISLre2 family transposase [Bacillota bacterium]
GLGKALREARGAARKRVSELRKYLLENWDGIKSLPEDERLGAIEGQVRHTICRRMKRINARWSPAGTDRMARLLAAGANDELARYASVGRDWRFGELVKVLDKEAVDLGDQIGAEDLEAWVRRTMPALAGPHASRPWVKYILRTLTSIRTETLTA